MTDQLSLDEAVAQRDRALAQVDEHADPDWKDQAFLFLTRYLESHDTMFVDDLWAAGLEPTVEDRALGAVFQRAARAGLMTKSGHFRKSVRSHLTEKPVWRSLIHELPDLGHPSDGPNCPCAIEEQR